MTAPVADQRILRGTSSVLSWQNLDGDGNAAEPAGDVTVGVVNAAGSTVVADGTATDGIGASPRTFTLPAADNTQLDLLTVTWTDDDSTHSTLVEVVGGFYFTLAEARGFDTALANDSKYPDSVLVETRRAVEEEFEQICDVAFVPRYRRERLRGLDRPWLTLGSPRATAIRSVTSYSTPNTGTAWTEPELDDIAIDDGIRIISRSGKWFPNADVVVEYEHGYARPPTEVKRAALQRLRYLASQPLAGLPDRATSFSVAEGGTYRLDTASAYRTGMPDVDAVLGRWSLRIPGVA